jgi:hypothetical protein
MRLPRFSIASVLAVIAILAVALAALRNPSYLWANATFSFVLGALVVAVVNVVYGRNAGRAYWLGFSLCGGVYIAVCTVPGLRDSVCPRLVTEVVLDFLYPVLAPEPTLSAPAWNLVVSAPGQASPPTQATFSLTQDPYSFQNVQFNGGLTSLVSPSPPTTPWAAWTEPDRTVGVGYRIGPVSLRSSEAFRQIGHSMVTLVVAILGGTFARRRYRNRDSEMPGSQSAP